MFAIGHAQRVALLLQRQTVRNVKRRPERVDQDPVGAEFQDAAVAVAVRYEEDAVRGHGHVGRLAEVGRVAAGHERRTQRQRRQPTAFRKLEYLMESYIGDPRVSAGVDFHAVGHVE